MYRFDINANDIQAEIVTALQVEANIEPGTFRVCVFNHIYIYVHHAFFSGFTCLVWQKLEEQNPSFFYVYNIMLRLKDQIVAYNYLVRF